MKKTLIFVSILAIVMFLISSCTPEARFNKVPIHSIGGGGSGGSIECYSNEDCAESGLVVNYCQDGDACQDLDIYACMNPGEYDSYCYTSQSTLCEECDYGCDMGECIEQTEITYIDPTSCEHMWLSTYDGNYTNGPNIVLDCGIDRIVQTVNFVQCDDNRNIPKNTGYSTIAEGWLSYETQYTCIDAITGSWEAPTLISGFCCDIKNAPIANRMVHKTTIKEDGTITRT